MLRTDYAHEEAIARFGGDPRTYCILTKEFLGDSEGNVCGIRTVLVRWEQQPGGGRPKMVELPGTEKVVQADLVLLSMGFLGPEANIAKQLNLDSDARSNIKATHGEFNTNVEGVYAAGDCRRGQSLVVWAINEGRGVAKAVDTYLKTKQPVKL